MKLTREAIFEQPQLVAFFELMRDAIQLRDAMRAARDASIEGSARLDPEIAARRQVLIDLSSQLLVSKIEEYLNDALANLKTIDT